MNTSIMMSDYHALAQALEARHPTADRLNMTHTTLRELIAALPGQGETAAKLDENDLEAVMTAWIDLEGDDAL